MLELQAEQYVPKMTLTIPLTPKCFNLRPVGNSYILNQFNSLPFSQGLLYEIHFGDYTFQEN